MKVVVFQMTVCAQMIDHLVFITGMIYFHQKGIIHRDLKSRNGECITDTSFVLVIQNLDFEGKRLS